MFAPQQATIFLGKRRHFIGHRANQFFLFGILHIDGGTHVKYASVDMAKHPVGEASGIQRGAELGDIVRQVLRRYGGIFHKRNGPFLALHITE